MTCEICWTEACFQAATLGGYTDDRYREQLKKHPEHELHDCGYPVGTFACKIRHIQINTGAAKAAND